MGGHRDRRRGRARPRARPERAGLRRRRRGQGGRRPAVLRQPGLRRLPPDPRQRHPPEREEVRQAVRGQRGVQEVAVQHARALPEALLRAGSEGFFFFPLSMLRARQTCRQLGAQQRHQAVFGAMYLSYRVLGF